MATYAITGTSRGIGLEMVRQLQAAPASKVKTIIAITRNKDCPELNDLIAEAHGRVVNIAIPDITDEKTVQSALPDIERALPAGKLDVLVNNAGTTDWNEGGLPSLSVDTLMQVVRTNVGSVHAMSATLLPLLMKGQRKTVLNISTGLSSMSRAASLAAMSNYSYKTSKAALNMLTTQYALQYGKEGFTFLLVSPGWLKTELGTDAGDLPVEVGVKNVLEILDRADTTYNGKFLNIKVDGCKRPDGQEKYDGGEIAW